LYSNRVVASAAKSTQKAWTRPLVSVEEEKLPRRSQLPLRRLGGNLRLLFPPHGPSSPMFPRLVTRSAPWKIHKAPLVWISRHELHRPVLCGLKVMVVELSNHKAKPPPPRLGPSRVFVILPGTCRDLLGPSKSSHSRCQSMG
jgi:hypothetical protein